MSKKTQSTLLLLLTSIIWGSSFIIMKNAVDFLTPSLLLMVRFSLASLFLTLMFYNKVKTLKKEYILGGILTGFILGSDFTSSLLIVTITCSILYLLSLILVGC